MINVNYKLTVSPSPHVHTKRSTKSLMRDVLIALLPAAIISTLYFGMPAVMTMLVSAGACVFFEYFTRKLLKRSNTISDLSAIITGLLIAFNVPSTLPVWMVIIGDFVAIVVVKQFFGGLGQNFVNPAIAARIVLMVSFPVEMTTFPVNEMVPDVITTATPLALIGSEQAPRLIDLLLGYQTGCPGEVCAVALLIGFVYLLVRKVVTPIIPVCFAGTVALIMFFVGGCDLGFMTYHLLSGGLILGACFMATDYVTSPVNTWGKVVFGIGCGLITCLIRLFGASTEGVSFAIIIMNIFVPHIERITRSRVFGEVKS